MLTTDGQAEQPDGGDFGCSARGAGGVVFTAEAGDSVDGCDSMLQPAACETPQNPAAPLSASRGCCSLTMFMNGLIPLA